MSTFDRAALIALGALALLTFLPGFTAGLSALLAHPAALYTIGLAGPVGLACLVRGR
jgi:hypothetical protein